MRAGPNFNLFSTRKPHLSHLGQSRVAASQIHNAAGQLKRCSSLKELESVYATMVKTSSNQDCFFVNQFITACISFNRVDYSILAYSQMENPNVFVYNAMIRGFVEFDKPIQALQIYVSMLRAEVLPSSYTFSSLVKACNLLSESRFGEAVHGHIWRTGFPAHLFIQTSLVDFYSNIGRMEDSKTVFDEMPERDAFAWTTLISGFVRNGDLSSARRLFDVMPERNIATWNTLIHGYARLRNVELAEELFYQMPEKDVISWTTMIRCYTENGKFKESLQAFNEMTKMGITADAVTMATVISACAHLGALDLGKEIHYYVISNAFKLDVYIGSALIDMYAKCGSLDRSLLLFYKLQQKNLFCWNAVIDGLAVHGYAEAALAMFVKMEWEKIKPNGVTFISVLRACTHAGLVEEGRRKFESMICDYSIPPEIEHYGCMVDLLAKAGLLEEALELIKNMSYEPNAVIWGALLGGCKLHRNLMIAQIAVDNLRVLEPGNSGYYSLLVNMYAEVNRWGEAAKVRAAMKNLRIEKTCPGASWIEMERKIYRFAASDKSHQSSDEICSILYELDGQLKLASYAPDFSSML
ncbi:hypothetical protein K2173_018685 [Erythroxylum novogranatense]|uniref:Chlororespiratory reduction 4 n=1 Tax=Erythroxylum novogranatense TaxID=1862640 RepID=A0AAV8SAH2_9ROSI|nr:hypothetical protein K2173_018685 [Erythroxylum novogranatense]